MIIMPSLLESSNARRILLIRCFKTSGNTLAITHSHFPEDMNLQQHYCYSLQSHNSEGHRPKLKYENQEGIAKQIIQQGKKYLHGRRNLTKYDISNADKMY